MEELLLTSSVGPQCHPMYANSSCLSWCSPAPPASCSRLRICTALGNGAREPSLFTQLHWLPMHFRIQFKTALLLFKTSHRLLHPPTPFPLLTNSLCWVPAAWNSLPLFLPPLDLQSLLWPLPQLFPIDPGQCLGTRAGWCCPRESHVVLSDIMLRCSIAHR